MKTKEQIEQEVKAKIMLHVKGLIKPNLYDKCFAYLRDKFFDDLITTGFGEVEEFQIISAIFLSLQKGLLEEELYVELAIVQKVYKILLTRLFDKIKDREEIEILVESNKYYQQKLDEIIKNK